MDAVNWSIVSSASEVVFKVVGVIQDWTKSKKSPTIKIPIDFVSSIISCALLDFAITGTKFTKGDFQFNPQAPYFGHSFSRGWYNDSIENQALIAKIIALFAFFFPPNADTAESKDAKYILECAKRGLERLYNTYKDPKCDVSLPQKEIRRWIAIIDEAFLKPLTIEGLTDGNRKIYSTVSELWKEELHLLACIFKEARKKQGEVDPNNEIKCQNEITYITQFQKEKALVLPSQIEAILTL